MTEQEWLTSDNPKAMLQWVMPDCDCAVRQSLGSPVQHQHQHLFGCRHISDRKLRLIASAFASISGCVIYQVDRVEAGMCNKDGLLEHLVGCFPEQNRQRVQQSKTVALRDIVGNPFRPVVLRPLVCARDMLHRCVSLAQAIYDDRDFALMPILADALEDAGCQQEEILRHCRGYEMCPKCLGRGWLDVADAANDGAWCWCDCNEDNCIPLRGPHARGCWCLDLILGNE